MVQIKMTTNIDDVFMIGLLWGKGVEVGYAGSWPCWLFLAAFNFENEKTIKNGFFKNKKNG